MKSGALAVWVNAAPEAEADFNAWYTAEHVPERVDIAGFRSGARYKAISGSPRYLAWYETDSVDVLTSPDYLERLNNPTEWTRRIMPSFRDTVRSIFEVRAAWGRGRGGVAATARLPSMAGGDELLVEWLANEAVPSLRRIDGIVGAQLWTAAGGPAAATSETELRGRDAVCTTAVLIEATDTEPARRACREWLSARRLRQACGPGSTKGGPAGSGSVEIGIYRMLFALHDGGR